MGTPDFAVPIFQKLLTLDLEIALVVTQPDRPVGRKQTLAPPPVKREAVQHRIPVFQPENLTEQYDEIINYQPDLIITAAYGQLLPKALLDFPKFGCINVHASLLPELRGGAPIHHAILQDKKETGITIMYMVEKLDAGDILSQQSTPITEEDDVGTLHDRLAQMGAELLVETLPSIFDQTIRPVKQKEELATFAPNITRKDEKINWQKTSREIFNQIRGLRPWPGAYTLYKGERIKIWKSKMDSNKYNGKPGEIIQKVPEEAIIVKCGDEHAIRITEIQPAGSKRMKVSEFLRGAKDHLNKGEILGK